MKVYDAHVHIPLAETLPRKYEEGTARTISLAMKTKFKMDMSLEDMMKTSNIMYDPGGEKFLKAMDIAGIEKAVIFSVDIGEEIGDPGIHPFETNRTYAEMAQKHPDRYVALAALDPRRSGALEHYEDCLKNLGMKGLKLHPAAGFYPADEVLTPFYELSAQYNAPVLIHSGTQVAAPIYFDPQKPTWIAEAAARNPDTKFIMAHVGMDLHVEAVMHGKMIPNLYFDVSAHQMSYVQWGADRFYQWLRDLIDVIGAFRIMWATDSPLPSMAMAPDLWVKTFTKPNTKIKFSKEEMEQIMHGTAAELFGI